MLFRCKYQKKILLFLWQLLRKVELWDFNIQNTKLKSHISNTHTHTHTSNTRIHKNSHFMLTNCIYLIFFCWGIVKGENWGKYQYNIIDQFTLYT